ncbi:PA5502 family lipoprotein [Pseudomonas coleopterorum]|uniref:PA5502 family lipoprotein n=1 Tax=Pseudomonas coleopterorum TaxID=1605838 RepID=UPI002A6A6D90|nr:PA5502 family lipoprotein [Pseudomonas coleopterorum]MDY1048796.1 PA5502 family lipoprotein [Pseudomonas coleopterorum]
MKPFASRYLLLATLSLLLTACQTSSRDPAADAGPDAWQQLETNIASSELATAEDQLVKLQAEAPQDPRVNEAQRQLAEAYLQRSQVMLQKGDVNAAATALGRARVLMPQAPALIGGVNGAIAQARKAELEKAEAALKAAEARPKALVLDPNASVSAVPLKMHSAPQLRAQMRDIATDVVHYQCDVIIQVAQPGEYRRLEALLKQRVSEQLPEMQLKVGRRVVHGQPTQVVLIPRR